MLNLSINWFEKSEYQDSTIGGYCDQTMAGIFFCKYSKDYNLKIDVEQNIVWNIIPDKNQYLKYNDVTYKSGKIFYQGITETGIIHMPGKCIWGQFGYEIFKDIQEKTYL